MEKPFSFLVVHHELLSPVQFKLRIILVTNRPETHLEVVGHLVGPRCKYSNTVEIRYHLQVPNDPRPFSLNKPGFQAITRRLVIPEPCQWAPQTPFIYEGVVQLVHGDQELQRWPIHHGLRLLDIFPQQGLAWNGKPFCWQGVFRRELSETDILGLNKAGVNTILAPAAATDLWEKGDQFGFILIGEVDADERSMVEAFALQNHPCCGAFLFPDNTPNLLANHPLLQAVGILKENKVGLLDSPFPFYVPSPLISPLTFVTGLRLNRPPPNPLPAWVSFVACSEDLLPELGNVAVPKLLLCQGDIPANLPDTCGPILGAISLMR